MEWVCQTDPISHFFLYKKSDELPATRRQLKEDMELVCQQIWSRGSRAPKNRFAEWDERHINFINLLHYSSLIECQGNGLILTSKWLQKHNEINDRVNKGIYISHQPPFPVFYTFRQYIPWDAATPGFLSNLRNTQNSLLLTAFLPSVFQQARFQIRFGNKNAYLNLTCYKYTAVVVVIYNSIVWKDLCTSYCLYWKNAALLCKVTNGIPLAPSYLLYFHFSYVSFLLFNAWNSS